MDGVATLYDGLDAADAPAATIDGLILGTFRTSTVSSPNHNTKSVQVINDSKIVNDMALLKDSRDRSGNAFHGVETNLAGYLSQFKGNALEIPIDATEIMAVGDSLVDEIIFVGQR